MLTANVARWLWHKSAKWCRKNCQNLLKVLSQIFSWNLLKAVKLCLKYAIWTWSKKPVKLYNLIFPFALALNKHGLKMTVLANAHFGPQFWFCQHFDQRNYSLLCFFCMTHSSWRSLSNGCMSLYSRTMLSYKQSEHSSLLLSKSGLCNLKLCVTFVSMQKPLYFYLSAFATSYAFYVYHCFAMIAILQTSQDFSWISRIDSIGLLALNQL